MNKKCQYSMEFMIFFALLSVVFVIWLVIYSDLHQEVFIERDTKAITDLGKAIQTHIFLTSSAHSGYYSKTLIIPDKVGNVPVIINNTEYSFYLKTNNGDMNFNIPYMYGQLAVGENQLRNINGMVAVGDAEFILKEDGTLRKSNCSDGIDNDGDGLTDQFDGGCYRYPEGVQIGAYYDQKIDSELPSEYVMTDEDINNKKVYNYYIACKNANLEGVCDELLSNDANEDYRFTELTMSMCNSYTYGEFCVN